MSNLKQWILDGACDEPIEAVVIGEMGWGEYGSDDVPGYNEQIKNKVLPWEQAAPMLDYEFDSGYGAPGCNAVFVWTSNHVMAISQYDGSTSLFSIPRNPVDCSPDMPGG